MRLYFISYDWHSWKQNFLTSIILFISHLRMLCYHFINKMISLCTLKAMWNTFKGDGYTFKANNSVKIILNIPCNERNN